MSPSSVHFNPATHTTPNQNRLEEGHRILSKPVPLQIPQCAGLLFGEVTAPYSRHTLFQKVVGYCSLTQSCLTLRPHGLQHTRRPCTSPTRGAHSSSGPSHQWCPPTISSSADPFSSYIWSFPASGSFPASQYFASGGKSIGVSSISPSNEYSGLISFRMDWLDLLAVQGTLRSLLQHHSSKASTLWCSAFFIVSPTCTSIHDYWKNRSSD